MTLPGAFLSKFWGLEIHEVSLTQAPWDVLTVRLLGAFGGDSMPLKGGIDAPGMVVSNPGSSVMFLSDQCTPRALLDQHVLIHWSVRPLLTRLSL